MSDKRNDNNKHDDINEFFAQFDQATVDQNRRKQSDSSSADAAGRSGRGNASRSGSRPGTRSRRNAGAASESSGKTRRKGGLTAAASRKKQGGSKKAKASGGKYTWLKAAGFICLGLILGVGIYVGVIFMTAPEVDTNNIYSMLNQRSVMYDADGNEIDNLYFSDGNRTIVDYEDMPEDLVNAVVSIEDNNFWSHNGFNFIRMIGAVRDSIFGGGQISGTSTITQQLARNVYLSEIKSQRSLNRKISEAYCTIVLEKNLTKEEIMEAYLNTIYLGFNSYGVQAASQAYFSKNVQDLNTLECAALAALPQSPDTYSIIVADYEGSTTSSLPTVASTDSATYLYNGDISKDRRDMVLRNMEREGYITEDEMNQWLSDDLRNYIEVGVSSSDSMSSYFTDYVVEQLTDDIVSEYGVDQATAQDMIYTGGLQIYTTLDSRIQSIVEEEFDDPDNFAGVAYVRTNSDGALLSDSGEVLLYDYSHYFNDEDQFVLSSDEYTMESDGSMKILAGNRLNIYETEVNGEPDVSIEFKGMYVNEDGIFYFIESGALSIPQGYKTVDGDGNAVISAQFFEDYPDFFVASGDSYVVSSNNYSLKQRTRQPQAATVIMENSTGEIKAMMGGRGTTGEQLFNRATSTRQPGSSIKPIAVYGPGLQMSYEYERDGRTMTLDNSDGSNWGDYITAGSVINDSPINLNGSSWPKNAYSGYRGQMTLRRAVQQSVNTCAVKTFQQVGADYSVSMLKKVGITSVDEEGEVNDLNPAALALGGMTNGISPLELTAAYAVFPNGGEYKEPICYTRVLNSEDEVLFEKTSESEQVYDEGVAWIMTDILRTVVTQGIGSSAAIGSQPVGGKTGTTDNNYDAWFSGFTPQYTMALWMGNDVNIELTSGSAMSARFWSAIMSRVCEGLPTESFRDRPDNVISTGGEYYTEGTYSRVSLTPSTTAPESTTAAPTTEAPTTEAPTVPTTGSSSDSGTDPTVPSTEN